MRVDEKTLQNYLQREAARVPLPDDMWKHISAGLDKDAEAARKRKQMAKRLEVWKPAVAFVAAAGIFWLAIIPAETAVRLNVPRPTEAEAGTVQPGQNDLLQEVSRFVRFEKLVHESPAVKKYGFTRYSISLQ